MSAVIDAFDCRIRLSITQGLAATGTAPSVHTLAASNGCERDAIVESLHRLQSAHQIVLYPNTTEIWSAFPFSAMPSAFWVSAPHGSWWGNCAFCALGVAAIVGGNVRIFARVGAESEQLVLTVRQGSEARVEPLDAYLHIPIEPSKWYENVVSTCGHVHFFRSPTQVDDWCSRHSKARGELIDIRNAWRLARSWYGGYLSRDWKPWSATDLNRMLASCGLRGAFWHISEE